MLTPPNTSPHRPQAPGLITEAERAFLVALGRGMANIGGIYVDAGSFLGASAEALASGYIQSRPTDRTPHVHCFDAFQTPFSETCTLIEEKSGVQVRPGESFRPIFEANTLAVRDLLVVHEGDISDINAFSLPISLLFLDICKSLETHGKVVDLFFRQLRPDVGILVHQDYHHPHLPYIHVCTEYLAHRFEIITPRIGESLALRLKSRPTEAELKRVIQYDFSKDEQIRLMDAALARMGNVDTFEMQLARLVLRRRLFGHARFAQDVLTFIRRCSSTLSKRQVIYLDRILNYAKTNESHFSGW
ncbi:hypothetical protein [Sulfitobacter sp.]|uniref:hypothetical protein n=1 Tax=Sulfitobacter sp. TaxID=1903071 RepID=UPI00300173C1